MTLLSELRADRVGHEFEDEGYHPGGHPQKECDEPVVTVETSSCYFKGVASELDYDHLENADHDEYGAEHGVVNDPLEYV